jgi:hypothetical protein
MSLSVSHSPGGVITNADAKLSYTPVPTPARAQFVNAQPVTKPSFQVEGSLVTAKVEQANPNEIFRVDGSTRTLQLEQPGETEACCVVS